MRAPFPYYGAKGRVAPLVWRLLGDVEHYVEPFMGSMAVLLERPHPANRTTYSETVNDLDGLLVNAWRAIRTAPQETAEWASWPVTEVDKMARQLALVEWRETEAVAHLRGDAEWCSPRMAGYWLYGVALAIGSSWCNGGPWVRDDRGHAVHRSTLEDAGAGVPMEAPAVSTDGQGVHAANLRAGVVSGVPELAGRGVHSVRGDGGMAMPELVAWFEALARRLRHVRILCGDWSRCLTYSAVTTMGIRLGDGAAGVFLDPPYADTAGRSTVYTEDDLAVAHDVAEWALEAGTDRRLRIIVCGYEGEHGSRFTDAGWQEHAWASGGIGGMAGGTGARDGSRERLWASPYCLKVHQLGLFEEQEVSP